MSPLHGAVHAPTQGPHRIRLLTRAIAGLVLLTLTASGCTLFEDIDAQRTEIDLSLPNGHTLTVTIVDESRTLADARFAQDTDFVGVRVPGKGQPTLVPTDDPRIVRVLWYGSACDRSAEVAVSHDRDEFALRLGQRDPCDATAVPRGVVLTFRDAVPPDASATTG